MTYPKILPGLAHTHGIPLARARSLWDRAVKYVAALGILTPHGTPDWESVIAIFLKFVQGNPHGHHSREGSHSFCRGARRLDAQPGRILNVSAARKSNVMRRLSSPRFTHRFGG